YNLPGQELACLFGLMVWNLRLTRGFAQHPPPPQLPEQPTRTRVVTTAAKTATAGALTETAPHLPTPVEEPTSTVPTAEAVQPAEQPNTGAVAPLPADSGEDFRNPLDEVPWDSVLTRLGPDWKRASDGNGLTCPEGSALRVSSVLGAL